MFGLIVGLLGIVIPILSLYNLQKKFPIQSFIQLSEATRDILFHPTWDVMLMFFIVAAIFLYAISTGRGRIALILLSTYIAYGIASFFFIYPSIFGIIIPKGSIPHLIIFGGALFVSLGLVFKSPFGSFIRSGMRDIAWWNALLQSILGAGLLCSLMYTLLSPAETALLAPLTKTLVGSPEVQLGWIFAPFIWFTFLHLIKRE